MARHAEFEPLYKAFNEFVQLCLIQDKSLLWPDLSIWMPEKVAEVKRRVVDNPLLTSDYSFVEKLRQQMNGATPGQWMLLADIYFVYYLPSGTITPQKKRAGILWAIEQSGTKSEARLDSIWDSLKVNFARTGQRYHMKYAQFWLILLLAHHLKQLPIVERQLIMKDATRLQDLLDSLLESLPLRADRANDTRRAILHLSFPDLYEPIISSKDRERIIHTYQQYLQPPVPEDDDQKLYLIRQALTAKRFKTGKTPFKFDDLKKDWDSSALIKDVDEVEEKPAGMIFISYRRDDTGYIVDRIRDELITAFEPENIFRDIESIPLGVDFSEFLRRAMEECSILLAVIGDRWSVERLENPEDLVRREIATALNRNIPVIPVFVENASFSAALVSKLPQDLRGLPNRNGIRIKRHPDFRDDMETLIKALKHIIQQV